MTNWLKFAGTQLVQFAAAVVGLAVLIPPCLFKAWQTSPMPSIADKRPVDEWSWSWLNAVYGNPEDGVSGIQANYLPGWPAPVRAYLWSAVRNSCDALKYVFRAAAPDYRTGTYQLFGTTQRWLIGWKNENGFNVPVLHLWGAP